jgi:hypothetical protein
MQRLRGRGWVNATELPDHGITLKTPAGKAVGVETQRLGRDVAYRITDEGIAAKTAMIPLGRR